MPIISRTGRKFWKTRLLIGSIYVILITGAFTMIYPFAMMLSMATCSDADKQEQQLIPRYVREMFSGRPNALFRKYVAIRYGFNAIEPYNRRHRTRYIDFSHGIPRRKGMVLEDFPRIEMLPIDLESERPGAIVADINEFKTRYVFGDDEHPSHLDQMEICFRTNRSRNSIHPMLKDYVAFLKEKYKRSLKLLNEVYHEENEQWKDILPPTERPDLRTWAPDVSVPKVRDWNEFKKKLAEESVHNLYFVDLNYHTLLTGKYKTEARYNSALGAKIRTFFEVKVPPRCPKEPELAELWEQFVRRNCPVPFLEIADVERKWHMFLAERFGTVERYNSEMLPLDEKADYASFEQIPFPRRISLKRAVDNLVFSFLAWEKLDVRRDVTVATPEYEWGRFLKEKYGSLEALNGAHSFTCESFEAIRARETVPREMPPRAQADWFDFATRRAPLRWVELDDEKLWSGYLDKVLYNRRLARLANLAELNREWETDFGGFEEISFPTSAAYPQKGQKLAREFLRESLALPGEIEVKGSAAEEFRSFLVTKHGRKGALDGYGAKYMDDVHPDSRLPGEDRRREDWLEFLRECPRKHLLFRGRSGAEVTWLFPEQVSLAPEMPEGLYRKAMEGRYRSVRKYNRRHGSDYSSFDELPVSRTAPAGGRELEDWVWFLRNLKGVWRVRLAEEKHWQAFLEKRKYATHTNLKLALKEFHARHGEEYSSFNDVPFPREDVALDRRALDARLFLALECPARVLRLDGAVPPGHYRRFLRERYGKALEGDDEGESVDVLNLAHGTSYEAFDEVPTPREPPEGELARADWVEFVRMRAPLGCVKLSDRSAWAKYLEETAFGHHPAEEAKLAELGRAYGGSFASFDEVPFPEEKEPPPARALEARIFLASGAVPQAMMSLRRTPGELYPEFLRERYGRTEEMNGAYRRYASFEDTSLPYEEIELADFRERRWGLFWSFLFGNYIIVADFLAVHGRALLNTMVYCLAMVLTHTLVNPMCAYALSRFRLTYGHHVLLFLLATMSFPPMVTMIPNFLLLKQFGLLNTYWALILPGMANGYSIFLLKGFFDSLPQELFEAGIIDGASEVQMFYTLAMPLSYPILAVIGLWAFTGAYGAFMFAFIVCQDPKLWTVMVFLYEFQQDYAVQLTMAALVLASLPTLIIFMFAQRVILRGIVIPQMK